MKFILAVLFLSVLFVQAFSQNLQPVKIRAGGVEFQYIEKGHGSPRENPQVFNEMVLKFLAAVENRPGKNAKH